MTNHPNRNKHQQAQPPIERVQAAMDADRNCKLRELNEELLAALKASLPYVERVAETTPFEPARKLRQLQACKDVIATRAAIAKAKGH